MIYWINKKVLAGKTAEKLEKEKIDMAKKEMMDLFLSKIPEDEKKKAFLEELRSAKTKKEVKELLNKYGIAFSEEEAKMLRESVQKKISAEDLKNVSGGDLCECWGGGICTCDYCYWY